MTFSIRFQHPHANWLPLDLRVGDWTLDSNVSAVANDPLRGLAELALFVTRGGHGQASVTFWLEPAGYSLTATRDPELQLSVHYSKHAFATLFDPELVLMQAVDSAVVAGEILRCLRAVRPMIIDRVAWTHPFPEELVGELESVLRA